MFGVVCCAEGLTAQVVLLLLLILLILLSSLTTDGRRLSCLQTYFELRHLLPPGICTLPVVVLLMGGGLGRWGHSHVAICWVPLWVGAPQRTLLLPPAARPRFPSMLPCFGSTGLCGSMCMALDWAMLCKLQVVVRSLFEAGCAGGSRCRCRKGFRLHAPLRFVAARMYVCARVVA